MVIINMQHLSYYMFEPLKIRIIILKFILNLSAKTQNMTEYLILVK